MAEVRYTRRALADLSAQEAWLRERNPQAGDRLAFDVARAERLNRSIPCRATRSRARACA